jgi:hypothetical protein
MLSGPQTVLLADGVVIAWRTRALIQRERPARIRH